MTTRRHIIVNAAAYVVLSGGGVVGSSEPSEWVLWKEKYLKNGRVIDQQNGSITHSEGQAYALLLAQAFRDKPAFEEIEHWTSQHLCIRQDSLMAWKWGDVRSDDFLDWRNATDGDLFRAWALLRAGRDSGWTEYLAKAAEIAHDISALCLAADPRKPDKYVLTPGAEARRSEARVLINPSYIMPRALRDLGRFTGDRQLVQTADHGEGILRELASTGFLPNWVDIDDQGFAPPLEHDYKWGYDALRIPLYLAWSGSCDHPALDVSRRYMSRGAIPGHVVVEATADGEVLTMSNRAGYLAILRLLNGQDSPALRARHEDYYASTLNLLVRIASHELGCAPIGGTGRLESK